MDLIAAIDAMERSIEEVIPFALLESVQVTVDAAKSGHPWQNRTGRTEATTRSDGVRGSWRGGYVLRIDSGTKYSGYLEEGWDTGYSISSEGKVSVTSSQWAYLLPAWERTADTVTTDVANAMADAVNRMN